jgi:allantoin racemase
VTKRIAVIGTGFTPAGTSTPPREILAMARTDLKPELIETRLSVFPGTPYERGMAALGYVEAGIRAQDEGYDGVFINTFGDYGIAELKSALRIPVIGAGEASMAVASTLGKRFAIVTIWPASLNFIFDEQVNSCAMGAHYAGLVNVLETQDMAARGTDHDPVLAMRGGKSTMLDRIVQACDRAVSDMKADTIILGCTCMAPIGALIAKRVSVPVVEPMTAGYAMTELQVSLRLGQSKVAYATPSDEALKMVRDLIAGAGAISSEACEPCAIIAAAE